VIKDKTKSKDGEKKSSLKTGNGWKGSRGITENKVLEKNVEEDHLLISWQQEFLDYQLHEKEC
jgi:hypothetical protein